MSQPVSPVVEAATTVLLADHPLPGVLREARPVRGEIVLDVRFEAPETPYLPVGDGVAMRIESPQLSRTITCDGRVSGRRQDAQFIEYEVAVARDDCPLLATFANRRTCIRVTPADDDPVQLVLRKRPDAPRWPLPVLDISGTGIAFVAPRTIERELAEAWRVHVEIRLPGDMTRLPLEARIVYRRLRGSYVQYGLDFDPSSEGFASTQDRIFRYVARREVELLGHRSVLDEERRAS